MNRRRCLRLSLAGGLASAVALGSAFVFAGHETAVSSYTGCLNVNGGTFVSLAPGNAPLNPCGGNQLQVHLSGGDITSVMPGIGLQGGSENGAALLDLRSSYRLPQACSPGATAKWSGTAWECGADMSAAASAFVFVDVEGERGIPNTMQTIRRILLPAGKYAIFLKLGIYFTELDSDTRLAHCQLTAESDVDTGRVSDFEGDSFGSGVISLMLVHEFSEAGFVDLACTDGADPELISDLNDAEWRDLRITALKLGSFENVPLAR